ncbi:MAG TPA: hypothetical protein VLG47_02480 [Candidatus Saccharimonadales bacterium]|nr:hypothetical protein [Candidatus Saccharimonadales bacterium]
MENIRVNFLIYSETDGQRYYRIVLGGAAVASEAILSVYAAGGTMFDASCCGIHDLPRKSAWWESAELAPFWDEVWGSVDPDETDDWTEKDAASGALFETV